MLSPAETKSGIVLPEQHRDAHRPAIGRIVICGGNCNEFQPGEAVIMSPMDGIEILLPTGPEHRDAPWIFIRESGIVGRWVSRESLEVKKEATP